MVKDLRQIVEKSSLGITQEAVGPAECVLLGYTRDRERLARKTCQQDVMCRHLPGIRRIGTDITGKSRVRCQPTPEVGRVGLLAEPVPLGGEHTVSADLLETAASVLRFPANRSMKRNPSSRLSLQRAFAISRSLSIFS